MTVTLQDGRTFTNAKVIGTDPATEVALIKIEGDDFPVLPLGDSDRLEVGDMVMAIGNPFGLTAPSRWASSARWDAATSASPPTRTSSRPMRPSTRATRAGRWSISNGRAIGINTAIVSESGGYMGIGFAIPVNMARTVADQLRQDRESRARLPGLLWRRM